MRCSERLAASLSLNVRRRQTIMTEPDSPEHLLQKLCECQEQQLAKLSELADSISAIAAESRATKENYSRQTEVYTESQRQYNERIHRNERGRIATLILLGLIVVAITVSRFL